MPNSVSLLTWGQDFSYLGGVISSKNIAQGGHVALKITIDSNQQSDQLIKELIDNQSSLKIKEVWNQVKLEDGRTVAKKSYEVYFSFRPGKKNKITKTTLVEAGKKGYAAVPFLRGAMNTNAVKNNPQLISAAAKTLNEIYLSALGYEKNSNPTQVEDRILEQEKFDKKQKEHIDLPGSINEEIKSEVKEEDVFASVKPIIHLEGLDNTVREVLRINELRIKEKEEELELAEQRRDLVFQTFDPLAREIYDTNLEIIKLNLKLEELKDSKGNDTEKELITAKIEELEIEKESLLDKIKQHPKYKLFGYDVAKENLLTYIQSIDHEMVETYEIINRIYQANQSLLAKNEVNPSQPSQFFMHDIVEANKYVAEEVKNIQALPPGSDEREKRVAELNDFLIKHSDSFNEKFEILDVTLTQRKVELEKELADINTRIAAEKPGRPLDQNRVDLKRVEEELRLVVTQLNTLDESRTFGRSPDSTITCSGNPDYGFDALAVIREADTILRTETQSRFGSSDAAMSWRALVAGMTPTMITNLRHETDAGKHLFTSAVGIKTNPGNLQTQVAELSAKMTLFEKIRAEEKIFNDLSVPEKAYHHLMRVLSSELKKDKHDKKYDLLNQLSDQITRAVMDFKLSQDKEVAHKEFLNTFKQVCDQLAKNKLLKNSSKKKIIRLQKEITKTNPHLPFPRKLGIGAYIRDKLERFKARLPATGVGGFLNRSIQSLINRFTTQLGEKNVSIFKINLFKFREIPRLGRYGLRNVARLFSFANQNLNKNEEKKLLTDLLHYKSLFSLYVKLPEDHDAHLSSIEKELSESREKLKFYEAKASIYTASQRYDGKKLSPQVAEVLNEVATLSKDYFKPKNDSEFIPPPPAMNRK